MWKMCCLETIQPFRLQTLNVQCVVKAMSLREESILFWKIARFWKQLGEHDLCRNQVLLDSVKNMDEK